MAWPANKLVVAGMMMCADIVKPNWILASSSAVRPNMIPHFQYPRQPHFGVCAASKTSGAARMGPALTIGLLPERP